ncbi:TRAP transporter large permease [Nesterenkonia haasae]|uniref:TRAP transporter large permease n=1 Tax=Nesterenkonia haasae TaxID=2587813 RepID=UPI001390A4C3|nr:TRAP transporter large permease [Nesterenkonia haasae]NDK33261.1 TRAP transporter large permease [Nesterenkonia haasae]
MDPFLAVLVASSVLVFMLVVGFPVAISLIASGLFGIFLLGTTVTPDIVVQTIPFSATAKYSWTVVPMFIFMGAFATASGLISSLFRIANRAFRRVPGGVGLAVLSACAGFSAVSGSSVATAATIGPIAGEEMRKARYRGSFSAGLVASAGTLGILIPPSIILVIYGIATGESIGLLLLAAIVPGILSALTIGATVVLLRVLRPQAVIVDGAVAASLQEARTESEAWVVDADPDRSGTFPGPDGVTATAGTPTGIAANDAEVGMTSPDHMPEVAEVRHSGMGAMLRLMVIFGCVMGGIYSGFVTVTESAALGAFAALVVATLDTWPRGWRSTLSMIRTACLQTASTTGMLFLIVVGSSIFSLFIVLAGIPEVAAEWVLSFDLPPLAVVGIILLAMIPLGMFLDPLAIVLIVVPIAHPIVVTELGFSGIWFAILVVKVIEIALVTPPVGLNIFVVAGVMKGFVTTAEAFRGVAWFVLADVLLILVLFFFPGLVTAWLPMSLG